MKSNSEIVNWLLKGDPSIRYQTLRDLTNADKEEIKKEQQRISKEGWGAVLLSKQDKEGTWAKSLYSPKWISTTYTLLQLKRMGLDQKNNQAKTGVKLLLDKGLYFDGGINYFKTLNHSETCVTGIVLGLLCYFQIADERINKLADFLFQQQMSDGGWNCQSFEGATHSSFHTTMLALEGLLEYEKWNPIMSEKCYLMRSKAIEFLLCHKLYKSHRTGKIAKPQFTRFSFPPRWKYDVMKALDYMQEISALKDSRFQDAIDLLIKKRTNEGLWKLNSNHPGKVYFYMEETGKPSRWNTLRALRILKWWNKEFVLRTG